MSESNPYRENAAGNSGPWTKERQIKIPEYKQQIVDLIASGLFISEICLQLDIGIGSIRRWRTEDKEFSEAYTDAESSVTDTIEKQAVRRARDGILSPVISKGQVVLIKNEETGITEPLMQRQYSDALTMFLLKGRRREIYGDKKEIDAKVGIDVIGAKTSLEAKFAAASIVTD